MLGVWTHRPRSLINLKSHRNAMQIRCVHTHAHRTDFIPYTQISHNIKTTDKCLYWLSCYNPRFSWEAFVSWHSHTPKAAREQLEEVWKTTKSPKLNSKLPISPNKKVVSTIRPRGQNQPDWMALENVTFNCIFINWTAFSADRNLSHEHSCYTKVIK